MCTRGAYSCAPGGRSTGTLGSRRVSVLPPRSSSVAPMISLCVATAWAASYVIMRAITSGHWELGASGAFFLILATPLGVYTCIALVTLLRRGVTALRLAAAVLG